MNYDELVESIVDDLLAEAGVAPINVVNHGSAFTWDRSEENLVKRGIKKGVLNPDFTTTAKGKIKLDDSNARAWKSQDPSNPVPKETIDGEKIPNPFNR